MPSSLPASRRDEYLELWRGCEIRRAKLPEVQRLVKAVLANRARYARVAESTGVPWWFIAAIHNLEASLDFTRHLHNGDPLSRRTVHVPKGRPAHGNPPFTWEESAVDALRNAELTEWRTWTVPGALYCAEVYNGLGYRKRAIRSPYLWAGSTLQQAGKYVADKKFDPNAWSEQIGAAALWKGLIAAGEQIPEPEPGGKVLYEAVLPNGVRVPCELKDAGSGKMKLVVELRAVVEGLGYVLDTGKWPTVVVVPPEG